MRISDWSSDVCSFRSPAVLAIAAGHVSLRAPCYRLVCPDAEWLEPTAYTTLWKPRVPGTVPRLRPARPSPLATRSYASLHAPATKREWFDAEASYAKVDTTYGMQAIRRPDTKVQLELGTRSEEHTSELQSLMRISYAVFCLKKKKTINKI